MDISYIRSSSYNNWDFCKMQYFISYVLGIRGAASKKADKGTVVHKVMECLAALNKANKETGKYEVLDDALGTLSFSKEDFEEVTELSTMDVANINSSRDNIYIYKYNCRIPYGTKRTGVKVVQDIFEKSYLYYSEKSPEKWNKSDKIDCENWTWIPLEYKKGMFDPRKLNIVEAEAHFDFPINDDLSIKGTIDLVTSPNEGVIEIIDWKTGQRKDWGKNVVKDYTYLCKDFQLMLYNYAARKLFPSYHTFMVTIFFVRDGGPYTIHFDDSTVEVVEEKLIERFNEIKNCVAPTMCDPTQKDIKCSKFCDYFKMKHEEDGNFCRHIHDKIRTTSIHEVTQNYRNKDFSVGNYKAPGGE